MTAGLASANSTWKSTSAASAARGSSGCSATRARPPASSPSLTGISAATSIASLPAKWW